MADHHTEGELVEFRTLAIGDEFFCYGDTFINYDYPKWCHCVKEDNYTAVEVGGIAFGVSPSDKVFVATKE